MGTFVALSFIFGPYLGRRALSLGVYRATVPCWSSRSLSLLAAHAVLLAGSHTGVASTAAGPLQPAVLATSASDKAVDGGKCDLRAELGRECLRGRFQD